MYIYIPGTCLSSILGFEPSKRRPFPIKTGVIWVPGIYAFGIDRGFPFEVYNPPCSPRCSSQLRDASATALDEDSDDDEEIFVGK